MTHSATPQRRRRWLRVTVLLVVLLLVLYAAGTWFYADRIRAQALEVTPYAVVRDVTVTDIGDGRITLDDSAEPKAALRDSKWLYGLTWDGGSGQVSGPARESDGEVTRDFVLNEGTAPTPGTEVALNRDLLVDLPRSGTPRIRAESYASGGHKLPAWYVDGSSTTWGVLVHGKGGSPAEMARMAGALARNRMPSLLISYRNDPGAPADRSGEYRYGATEWRDLRAAVDHARQQGARHVILGGASMGGAVVASYLEKVGTSDGFVVGAVLDAPMLDLDATVDYGASQVGVPGLLTDSAEWLAGFRFGIDWGAVDYLDDTSWVQVPVLVLHGTEDATVPLATSSELAKAVPDEVTLEVFRADHVESFNSDPGRYGALVAAFARQVSPTS